MIKVTISDIQKENLSFSQSHYKGYILPKSMRLVPLSDILDSDPKRGTEFGSSSYVDYRYKDAIPFLKISDIWDNLYTFRSTRETEVIAPTKPFPILKDGDLVIQTASTALGKISIYKGPSAAYNSHLRVISLSEYTYYILAFFNSPLGLNQFIQNGSIKGVDNFSTKIFEKILIPIPPEKELEKITNYAKRIVEIEIEMNSQRAEINNIIENFLGIKGENLLKEFRETSIVNINNLINAPWNFREHSDDYIRTINKIIESSKGKPEYLDETKLKGGNTPKKRIFGRPKEYGTQWVTPTNFDDFGYVNYVQSIASPNLKKITTPTLMIINRTSRAKGEYVGIAGYLDGHQPAHNNQGVYCYNDATTEHLIYLTALINSDIYRYLFQSIGKGAKMREIRASDISKIPLLKIPSKLKDSIVSLMSNDQLTGYLNLAEEHSQLKSKITKYFTMIN